MVMGGRVNEATDLATLKAAIANVSFGHCNSGFVKNAYERRKKNFEK